MQTEALYQAVLAAFQLNRSDTDDPVVTARAITDILDAFAALIAPPAVAVEGTAMVADDTPKLILAELQELRADLARRYAMGLATTR